MTTICNAFTYGAKPFLLIGATVLSLACAETVTEESSSSQSSQSGTTEEGTVPTPSPTTGQLVFEVGEDIDPTTVEGYVVGQQDTLKVKKAGDSYYIDAIPPGEHDIVVTAGTLTGVSALTSQRDRGLRKNSITVSEGQSNFLNEIDIPIAGSISGTVKLSGQSDHTGIDVYIPGTSYAAKTDSDGTFSLSSVPVGSHPVYAESDSYERREVSDVAVASAANTEIDALTLEPSSGASGKVFINDGAEVANSPTVEVIVHATGSAVFMRYTDDESKLALAQYVPFKSPFKFTFAKEVGDVTLYLQLKDADGIESAVIATAFKLTLADGTAKAVAPTADKEDGSYDGNLRVDLTTTESTFHAIYYTLDGTPPTLNGFPTSKAKDFSELGDDGLLVSCETSPTTLKAVTIAEGLPVSDVLTRTYTFDSCPVYLFKTDAQTGSLGGRSGVDALCETHKPTNRVCEGVGSFVSTQLENLKDSASKYDFGTSRPVFGQVSGTKIWDSVGGRGDSAVDVTCCGVGTHRGLALWDVGRWDQVDRYLHQLDREWCGTDRRRRCHLRRGVASQVWSVSYLWNQL